MKNLCIYKCICEQNSEISNMNHGKWSWNGQKAKTKNKHHIQTLKKIIHYIISCEYISYEPYWNENKAKREERTEAHDEENIIRNRHTGKHFLFCRELKKTSNSIKIYAQYYTKTYAHLDNR